MAHYDDKTLLDRLADIETKRIAFTELVQQYTEQLYWVVRRIVLTHEDANDVLQNIFIKVWNNISEFNRQSKLATWLYRIAINESLDFIRRKKNVLSTDAETGIANHLLADEYFDGDAAQAQFQQAIASLPHVQRTVFNLRYFDGMKYEEMSAVLSTSVGALKASYHIAVKKIQQYLKDMD